MNRALVLVWPIGIYLSLGVQSYLIKMAIATAAFLAFAFIVACVDTSRERFEAIVERIAFVMWYSAASDESLRTFNSAILRIASHLMAASAFLSVFVIPVLLSGFALPVWLAALHLLVPVGACFLWPLRRCFGQFAAQLNVPLQDSPSEGDFVLYIRPYPAFVNHGSTIRGLSAARDVDRAIVATLREWLNIDVVVVAWDISLPPAGSVAMRALDRNRESYAHDLLSIAERARLIVSPLGPIEPCLRSFYESLGEQHRERLVLLNLDDTQARSDAWRDASCILTQDLLGIEEAALRTPNLGAIRLAGDGGWATYELGRFRDALFPLTDNREQILPQVKEPVAGEGGAIAVDFTLDALSLPGVQRDRRRYLYAARILFAATMLSFYGIPPIGFLWAGGLGGLIGLVGATVIGGSFGCAAQIAFVHSMALHRAAILLGLPTDSRQLVLLLRSFKGVSALGGPLYMRQSAFMTYEAPGLSLLPAVAEAAAGNGPVIALGPEAVGPADDLGSGWEVPVLFLECSDADWLSAIRTAIDGAGAIVLIPDFSEGVVSEMDAVVSAGALGRTLVVVPPTPPNAVDANAIESRWNATRSSLHRRGWRLPLYQRSGLVYRPGIDYSVASRLEGPIEDSLSVGLDKALSAGAGTPLSKVIVSLAPFVKLPTRPRFSHSASLAARTIGLVFSKAMKSTVTGMLLRLLNNP